MFTIGSDPEFFIKKNQKYISAIGKIRGTKTLPRPLGRPGFAMLEDNVAVEFNIPPANSLEKFQENIQYALNRLQSGPLKNMEISTESAVYFDEDQLQDPAALEFGCEPDFNAWTKRQNDKPCAAAANLRSAGGHIHVGTNEDPIEVIRAMDLFLGVPSTRMDEGTLRRQLYGKAGCFRPKDYGCEYRTLSNFWIFTPALIEWVYNQTEKAVQFVSEGNVIDAPTGEMIQDCINNDNRNAYESLSKTFGLA